MRLQQMAADRGTVTPAQYGMRVDLALAILQRDVTGEREHLHLLVYRDLQILLLFPAEIAEQRATECADGREVRGVEPSFLRKVFQRRDHLVVGLEHECDRAAFAFAEYLGAHDVPSAGFAMLELSSRRAPSELTRVRTPPGIWAR